MNRWIDWARATGRRMLVIARAFGPHTVQVARCSHRFVRGFEPWGIILTFLGLAIALITIIIDLEDRQSERIFRAWQVVRGFESRAVEFDEPVSKEITLWAIFLRHHAKGRVRIVPASGVGVSQPRIRRISMRCLGQPSLVTTNRKHPIVRASFLKKPESL